MQIKLKNIGIVKDSSIELNGLTVITGKNNSGKSTVGKTLYALLDAVSNISEKYEKDRCNYIRNRLDNIKYGSQIFRVLAYGRLSDKELLKENPYLIDFIEGKYREIKDSSELEIFVKELIKEVSQFDKRSFSEDKEIMDTLPLFYGRVSRENKKVQKINLKEVAENEFSGMILWLRELIESIKKDPQQIAYTKESINQTLQKEFVGQIQPVRGQNGLSSITLKDENEFCLQFEVKNNSLVDNNENEYVSIRYKKVYLIDDPFILDNLERDKKLNQLFFNSEESLLNSGHILSHNDKLRLTLTETKSQSIFEQTVLNDKLKNIRQKMDEVLPGTFDLSSEGRYYIQDGMKLQVSNLATGSKMFSIIKILLDKGELDSSTMLILDEPEAHLHPMWQNAFAEIITLLVKELDVNVLLTTHSPNFVLALDAYMRKYKLEEKSSFYQTETLKDGFVQYNCMDDDMGKIYEDFLQYLSEVKMLRSFYMQHNEIEFDNEPDSESKEGEEE